MADANIPLFVNLTTSRHRPTAGQRQDVAKYIGKHHRNRSAPARRAQRARPARHARQPSDGDAQRHDTSSHGRTHGADEPRDTRREARLIHSRATVAAQTQADSPAPHRYRLQAGQLQLLRPIVEVLVPDYPSTHRDKVFHILDFHIHYLSARLTHWGMGPTPFMRCWVQMICADMTLFDAVATFTHGMRITTLEGQNTPSATMLWHKSRALKSLQAKIATDVDDRESTWTSNETILATFYLMEAAARFGQEAEFRAHCLGLIRMMELRGDIASGCLKDLFVLQAVGLVESTEMASELGQGTHSAGPRSSSMRQATTPTGAALRYAEPNLEPSLYSSLLDSLPVGFSELVSLGSVSFELVTLIGHLSGFNSQEQPDLSNDIITEPTERQRQVIRGVRELEKQSQKAVERLACLGIVAFLIRRTSSVHLFPEHAFLSKLEALRREMLMSADDSMPSYRNLDVWVTLVSAEMVSTAGAAQKQDADKVMDDVFRPSSWVNNWEDVERITRRYLWDQATVATWKAYWMECEAR